jgi:O-antigen/teichoic acid export membrane protein
MPPFLTALNNKILGSLALIRSPFLKTDNLRAHLLKGAAGSFIVQIGFAGFSFINALIFARLLGTEGYGIFANAIAWVTMLVIPATFGLGTILVREVSIYRSQKEWANLKGIIRFTNNFVIILSILFALVYLVVTGWIFNRMDQVALRLCLWMAAPLIPLLALLRLNESSLRGLEYVVRASLPNLIIRPGFLLLGIVLINIFLPSYLNPQLAMSVNVGTSMFALFVGVVWLKNRLPIEVNKERPQYKMRPWLESAFPMLVYSGLQVAFAQVSTVMLGALSGARDVGLFAASSRLAYLLTLVIFSFETILAPIIARLYKNHDKERLQNILTRSVSISFLSVLPFGLIMIFANKIILGFFGSDFTNAGISLNILVVGRLIDIALGSGALTLAMIGHERTVANTFAGMFVVNILLNVALILLFGLNGAAIASIVSIVMTDYLLSIFVAKKVGLKVTVFASLQKRNSTAVSQ